MTAVDIDELCGRCQHPMNPHLILATGETPMQGGVVLCNVKGCLCFATWSVGGNKADVAIPPEEELTYWREKLQDA